MSVRASISDFPPRMVPAIYRNIVPTAKNQQSGLSIWKMGEGTFARGPVAKALELRVDGKDNTHGLVEPDTAMPVSGYQAALAATKDKWDEEKF